MHTQNEEELWCFVPAPPLEEPQRLTELFGYARGTSYYCLITKVLRDTFDNKTPFIILYDFDNDVRPFVFRREHSPVPKHIPLICVVNEESHKVGDFECYRGYFNPTSLLFLTVGYGKNATDAILHSIAGICRSFAPKTPIWIISNDARDMSKTPVKRAWIHHPSASRDRHFPALLARLHEEQRRKIREEEALKQSEDTQDKQQDLHERKGKERDRHHYQEIPPPQKKGRANAGDRSSSSKQSSDAADDRKEGRDLSRFRSGHGRTRNSDHW